MTIYYAFTYPFTYTELQNYLEKLDKKFEKRIVDVKQLIKIISQLPRETGCKKKEFQRKEEAEEELELQKTGENILVVESSSSDDTSNSSSDETPTELIENAINSQFSEQSSSCLDKIIENPQQEFVVDNIQDLDVNEECETESYEIQQIVEPKNEIYYHRELLICSVEGRRVDLLTISSFHGIQEEREERLATLFPETDKLRCNTFENKKVFIQYFLGQKNLINFLFFFKDNFRILTSTSRRNTSQFCFKWFYQFIAGQEECRCSDITKNVCF